MRVEGLGPAGARNGSSLVVPSCPPRIREPVAVAPGSRCHCLPTASSLWRRRASGRAEMAVLLDFARGKKTYEDAKAEAQRYVLEAPILGNRMGRNTARTIQKRREALTGINTYSLTSFNIRKKWTYADEPLQAKRHPFNLITSTIKQRLKPCPHYRRRLRRITAAPCLFRSAYVAER
eukprot:9017033-Pyramimonas_sp.AAC.1